MKQEEIIERIILTMDENSKLVPTVYDYEGNQVSFSKENGVMVNATQMAKPFGKRPNDWLLLPSTKEFLEALSITRKSGNADYQAVITRKGGLNPEEGGTWLSEDAAIEFARWLSPKFAIWCNDRIKELMRNGVAVLPKDYISALRALADSEEQKLRLEAENAKMKPLVEYAEDVLTSNDCMTATEMAKELGFKSAKAFNNWCQENNILFSRSGRWLPYSKYSGIGWFATRTATYTKRDGTSGVRLYTVITELGRKGLTELYNKLMNKIELL